MRGWIRRLSLFATRRRLENDLDNEIGLHMDLAAAEYVRSGMTPEEALRRARREFGNPEPMREQYRDELRPPVLSDWFRDVRFGLRSLKRTPAATLVAIIMIAAGAGLTTLMLSAAYGAILRPPPFKAGERVMGLGFIDTATGRIRQMEALDLRDFRKQQTSFEALEGYYRSRISISDHQNAPQSISAAFVTANALNHLGVVPVLGRTFLQGEDFTSAINVTVISYALWQSRYGSQPGVIGDSLEADGRKLKIVGVMPEGFRFPFNEDLWMPMAFDLPPDSNRGAGRSFAVFGRLHEGVSRQSAETEARVIAQRLVQAHPDLFRASIVGVFPFAKPLMPVGVDSVLMLLLGAALGVMLIACANLAVLLTGRSILRGFEVGIRQALGATRRQVMRQFLIESMIVALCGGALGVGLVWIGTGVFNNAISGITRPYWVDVRVDGPVLAAVLILMAAVAVVAGAFPAWRASREFDRANGSAGLRTKGHQRGLSTAVGGMVTVQVALSFLLLMGAGLILTSLVNLKTADRGYDAEHVMAANFLLPVTAYPNPDTRSRLLLSVLDRAEQHPGVARAAMVRREPGTGRTFDWPFAVEGEPDGGLRTIADGLPVTHGYSRRWALASLPGVTSCPKRAASEQSRFSS